MNDSYQVVVPLNKTTNDCVWIYVDECLEVGDGIRSGEIKVTYGSTTTGNFVATTNEAYPPVQYTINQRKLFGVTYGSNNYNIEYYEEYLHNFDSEENTGLTEYEGMPWGLPGVQLSNEHQAILIGAGGMEDFTTKVKDAVLDYSPFYDFYLGSDVVKDYWSFKNDSEYNNLIHNRMGFDFCKEIIEKVGSITTLSLHEEPQSAIEYCYNKNKRNSVGKVVLNGNTGWYLPAIDEMEEIVMSKYTESEYSYARFEDFQNKFYWSSQPAYKNNYLDVERTWGDRYGMYMTDNTEMARSTKVEFLGGEPNDPNNYTKVSSKLKNEFGDSDDIINSKKVFTTATAMAFNYIHAEMNIIDRLTSVKEYSFSSYPDEFSRGNNDGNWKHTIIRPEYQEGAKHRTNDKARVRCVRKK